MKSYSPSYFILLGLLTYLFFKPSELTAQMNPIGQFDHHQDVGQPKLEGSAVYDPQTQTYTMTAGGINMWDQADQFHFIWKKMSGDFILRATVQFVGEGTHPQRKMGIIARDQLSADSRYVDASVHDDQLTALQYRSTTGGDTEHDILSVFHPTDIEFQRKGNVFTFSAATFGENFKSVSRELALNEEAYVRLFLCSHVEDVIEKAIFSNVRIIIPADDDFVPYQDYIGSNLEVMDIESGQRKILHTAPNSLQADKGRSMYPVGRLTLSRLPLSVILRNKRISRYCSR